MVVTHGCGHWPSGLLNFQSAHLLSSCCINDSLMQSGSCDVTFGQIHNIFTKTKTVFFEVNILNHHEYCQHLHAYCVSFLIHLNYVLSCYLNYLTIILMAFIVFWTLFLFTKAVSYVLPLFDFTYTFCVIIFISIIYMYVFL